MGRSLSLNLWRCSAAGGGASAVPENITLTWSGDTFDLTPQFAQDSTEFAASDILELRRSPSDATVLTYTSAQITINSIRPVVLSGDWDFSGDWTPGTWYTQLWLKRGASYIGKSNIETLSLTSVAPVLSLPTDTSTGATTASGTVSTTQYDGTLYAVVTTSATSPSAAQVKAGQNHLGAAAAATKSQAVTATGVQTISGGFTGLSASTTYYVHYMHENRWSQQSNVSSADGFTTSSLTPSLSSPTAALSGSTSASGSVSTTGTDGTLYAVITTSATPPSAAQVKAGQNHLGAAAVVAKSQAVTVIGAQAISGGFTGLSASTTYYAYYMHEAVGPYQSTVASAASFTTDPAANPSVYVGRHGRDAAGTATSTHSVDFGTINFQKTAVVAINLFSSTTGNIITGVTVAGNAATQVVQHNQGFSHTAIFRIDVTSGGTKSIVVTTSAIMYNIDVAVHILTDMNPVPTATDKHQMSYGTTRTLFNGSSGNGTGTQSLPSGGVMILSYSGRWPAAATFPPATTDADNLVGSSGAIQSAHGHHYGSDIDPVATAAANVEFSTVGAIWGP